YGVHVYNKGADVAHTLRGYMGDSLFWAGLQYHMNISQFSDVSSADFRDNLIVATGLTYLNDFFNDWVFNPGFPHFSIDSVVSVPNGPDYDVTVYVEQKLRGAPNFYTNVPLEFSFFENDMSRTTQRVLVSGQYFNFTTTLPFDPVMTAIDVDGKISDAITDEERTITAAGTQNYTAARCTVTVMTVPDTTYMRIEHNWAAPDAIQNNPSNYRISSLRYWTIDGIIPAGFYAKARFYYDGRTGSTAGPGQWLDNDLTIVNGDSIILLYRRDASEEWQEWPYYSKTVIGPVATSKYGYAEIDSLAKGEYAFACGVSTVLIGVDEEAAPNGEVIAYPNPACDQLTVEWPVGDEPVEIRIYDTEGRLVHAERAGGSLIKLVTDRWSGGIYNVEVIREGQLLGRNKVLIYRH
ncbi:MAG TPA: T9SS type A sorting domain-containing protein, partial [Bacteroidia bacterium]|nr:T9SS type A sorting domain-containing protein [Bacteroidia bacterium]